MKITVSEYIVQKLVSFKIKKVPVFQGEAIFRVIDDIGENKDIEYFCPLHKQVLGMEVDAESRINGFSVGFVTSGPGATNSITGLAKEFLEKNNVKR